MNAKVKISEERLLKVLLAPVISEKATFVAEKNNQAVFRVMPCATKPEIKAAVESLFKVDVKSVQITNRKGKEGRFGKFMGRRANAKLAYVNIAPGQDINFFEEAK